MRHVKGYQELFEAQIGLTREQIKWLDMCTHIISEWEFNEETGLVDVYGDFHCPSQGLTDLKGIIFGKIEGSFDCSNNRLTSLEGAPQEVGGGFDCSRNLLKSLEGAAKKVGTSFLCYGNQLTSLEGSPRRTMSFYCYHNDLTSLKGAPEIVHGFFDCSNNSITSLDGVPLNMSSRDFRAAENPVSEETLEALYKRMKSGMGWDEAVEMQWDYIDNENDQILLAPSNPKFSPDEKKGYEVLAKLRKRVI
jgi:hypothetical protein